MKSPRLFFIPRKTYIFALFSFYFFKPRYQNQFISPPFPALFIYSHILYLLLSAVLGLFQRGQRKSFFARFRKLPAAPKLQMEAPLYAINHFERYGFPSNYINSIINNYKTPGEIAAYRERIWIFGWSQLEPAWKRNLLPPGKNWQRVD